MKNVYRLLSVACLTFLICSAGCTVAPPAPAERLASTRPSDDVLAGGKLFSENCASCHGLDAQGGTRAPSLQTPSVRERSDAALAQFLTDGDLRRGMPSWSQLSAGRRLQLVRFIRSLSAREATNAP